MSIFPSKKTLTDISLRESSLGKFVLGDKKENGEFKPLKEMSLGPFQIRLFTQEFFLKLEKNQTWRDIQNLFRK